MRARAKQANLETKKANEILLAFKKLDAQRELEADAAIAGQCAALRCAALCSALLCSALLNLTLLFCAVLCSALVNCAALRCAALCCAVLCCAVLCCAVLCLAGLCCDLSPCASGHIMPCHAMLSAIACHKSGLAPLQPLI